MEDRIYRARLDAARAEAERREADAEAGSESAVLRTKAVGTYPTAAGSYFACSPVAVGGAEAEGTAATLSVDTSRTIYAYNLGSSIPPSGTYLVAHAAGGRWTFRYDG